MQIRFVHSGDSFEEGKTLAEARWQKLEPAIIEFLEKPTQMPSLRSIRNDFACLNHGLRPSVPPLEEGLVPFYLLTLVESPTTWSVSSCWSCRMGNGPSECHLRYGSRADRDSRSHGA